MDEISLRFQIVSCVESPYYSLLIKALVSDYENARGRQEDYWLRRFTDTSFNIIAGIVLQDNSKVVGILGCIEPVIGVCGLSVWWVDESKRKYSMGLLSYVLSELGDVPVVNSSANPTASKVFDRLRGWRRTEEYLGIPKRILGFTGLRQTIQRPRLCLVIDDDCSLFALLYRSIRNRKITLSLTKRKSNLIYCYKISVYFRGDLLEEECISHYGDRYE